MKRQGWIIVLLVFVTTLAGMAQTKLSWDPKAFMAIDEIKPGMTGYGKTTFQGTNIETFNVEVIGVLKKIDFGQDMILIRLTSGPVVERKLQTVEGMSGSPIYINGRLIGAYAYGWPFQQEPIAGVTPIAAMLDDTQPGSVPAKVLTGSLQPREPMLKIGKQVITRVKVAATRGSATAVQAKADPATMVMIPASTPLQVSGVSDASVNALQKFFAPYNMRAVPGPGRVDVPAPKLEPGSSVAVSLLEGDANISAVGTVTYVKGDTVLAFGHTFMGLGEVDMPMSVAYVTNIMNGQETSFVMASPIKRVGALTSDRQHAVGGVVGRKPNVIPITMNLTDENRRLKKTFRADLIANKTLAAYLMYTMMVANGATQLAPLDSDEGVFTADALVRTETYGDIRQHLVTAPIVGAGFAPLGETYLLVDALLQNPYEAVKINGITFDLGHAPKRATAAIERVTPDRKVARPGDTITLAVQVRPYGKSLETHNIAVQVPEYITDNTVNLVVVGGNHGTLVKPMLYASPATEEGVRGLIRWITETPSPESLLAVEVLPEPSYAYHGRLLKLLPDSVFDLLRAADQVKALDAGGQSTPGMASTAPDGEERSNLRPTTYVATAKVPYVLTGAQSVSIAIDAEEHLVEPATEGYTLQVPVLSQRFAESSQNAASDSSDSDESASDSDEDDADAKAVFAGGLPVLPWQTPQQQQRLAMLADCWKSTRGTDSGLILPVLRERTPLPAETLSIAHHAAPRQGGVMVSIEALPAGADQEDTESEADEISLAEAGDTGKKESVLLSKPLYQWGIVDRKSFQRGKHIGTSVTSEGYLTLAPAVRALSRTAEYLPAAVVSTTDHVYVAGWNSALITPYTADGTPQQPFSVAEGVEAVTAMAADGAGQLLVASLPDGMVRLNSAQGKTLQKWHVPGTAIWALAVTEDGRRFAGTDVGALYRLPDDGTAQLVASVPDRHVLSLCAAGKDLYLGTAPRGKVYKFAADDTLTAVYEGVGAASALAVDRAGNLYVGSSPTCRVVRVSPHGATVEVMTGIGRGNKHVQGLVVLGDSLFAATAPAGGIYYIANPDGDKPIVTPIFARDDVRNGEADTACGPESVMVNGLALAPDGTLVAIGNLPGQVLKLEPRKSGEYQSYTLASPQEAVWGRLQMNGMTSDTGQDIFIDSRSGNTAIPDQTWSAWQPVPAESGKITSPPALFAQLRVRMKSGGYSSPLVNFLRMNFQPRNQAPQVRFATPVTGAAWNGTKALKWDARDPDGDKLRYTVFLSADSEKWVPVLPEVSKKTDMQLADPKPAPQPKKKSTRGKNVKTQPAQPEPPKPETKPEPSPYLAEPTLRIDTKDYPDGQHYWLKVVATDRFAKPDQGMSAEIMSGIFAIDNTKPVMSRPKVADRLENLTRLEVADVTTIIVGGRFRIDEQPWTALVAEDGVFDSTREQVRLVVAPDPKLSTEAHKLTVQIEDAAGNMAEETFTFTQGVTNMPVAAN